jgi:hypothetical protein
MRFLVARVLRGARFREGEAPAEPRGGVEVTTSLTSLCAENRPKCLLVFLRVHRASA